MSVFWIFFSPATQARLELHVYRHAPMRALQITRNRVKRVATDYDTLTENCLSEKSLHFLHTHFRQCFT